MHLLNIALPFFGLLTTASASIHTYSETNMSGQHDYYPIGDGPDEIGWNTCHSVSDNFTVVSVVASGNNDCYLFDNTACDPHTGSDHDCLEVIANGGYWDLGDPEIGWGGRVKAFKCQPVKLESI